MKRFLLLPALQLVSAATFAQKLPELKNVVVIIADDHALGITGAYGNPIVRTPNLDALSEQGVTFSRAYCNSPISSASRQSLLTGKYPHSTGVNLLFTPFPDEGNTTIAEHLKTVGYNTALFGKTHWNNWMWQSLYTSGVPNHGFDRVVENEEYHAFINNNPPLTLPDTLEYYGQSKKGDDNIAEWMNCNTLPHPIDDAHSMGTFLANQAIDFMKQNENTPFFVWLAFKEPHHPYYFPVEYAGKYNPNDMPLPQGSPEDDRWIPECFRSLTDDQKRGIIASYYTSTEYMDKNTGLVLNALDSLGLSDNTLVVYISDNGYLLNDHKRFEKHTMWQQAINQPLIIRAGKSFRAGQRCDALVEYVDVVPTILDMIGVKKLKEAQGNSFTHVLTGKNQHHREYVFSEYLQDNLAMVSTTRWKYVFTTGNRDLSIGYATGYGPSGIVHRLYDLENDPGEKHDVSKSPENKDLLLQMQQLMLARFMQTHPDAPHCPKSLTLEGKLVWFCEPRDVGDDQHADPRPLKVFAQ